MLGKERKSSQKNIHILIFLIFLTALPLLSCGSEPDILLILDPPLKRQLIYELQQQGGQNLSPLSGTPADSASLQKALRRYFRQRGYTLEIVTVSPDDVLENEITMSAQLLADLPSRSMDRYSALILAPWQRKLGEEISGMEAAPEHIYVLGQVSPEYPLLMGIYLIPDFGDPALFDHIQQRRGEGTLIYDPEYIEASVEAILGNATSTDETSGRNPDSISILKRLSSEFPPSAIHSTGNMTPGDLEDRLAQMAEGEKAPLTLYLLLSPEELGSLTLPPKSFSEVIATLYQPDIVIRGGFPFSFLRMLSRIPEHFEAGDRENIFISVPFFIYNK